MIINDKPKGSNSPQQTNKKKKGSMFRRSTHLLKKPSDNWKAMTRGQKTVKNGRKVLIQYYRKCLEDIKEIPITAAYRQNVEAISKYRLNVCEATHSHREIEMACEGGIIENLIDAVKMELELIPMMIRLEPWKVHETWQKPKLIVDGFEFDWRKLREDRLKESWEMRTKLGEKERKQAMQQWLEDSNPDLEIYPAEMVRFKPKGVYQDLKAYKKPRFGA
ncbi:hypothetical protein RFI_11809 [Reticulomyxa filosa]|uniref:Uncharacterized protein n=1 Tax=Reticulomyxa filosa TaxID=46433 RepID=X6NHF4_RETFI|nr:hypothetical protein RFI_11809 [Reticulomyxa filosa]|eukprot:ETO25328.1 hypothetical protein RFI_11809 [Reticulomyxa filosa]